MKPTVTIGIPAYNEAANLDHLLDQILTQAWGQFQLCQILVYSDASTDATPALARARAQDGVTLISGRRRRGVAYATNVLARRAQGDYLILLNADITLLDQQTLPDLLLPLLKHQADFTSAQVVGSRASGFYAQVLNQVQSFKNSLYQAVAPNSIYLCHGRARAFTRALYQALHYPTLIADDAYSYLAATSQGYRFAFVASSVVLFASPQTFADYASQSRRFRAGIAELKSYFPDLTAYHLPFNLTALRLWLGFALRHPLTTTTYLLSLSLAHLAPNFGDRLAAWRIATTSKAPTRHRPTLDVVVKYFYPVTAGIETNVLETYTHLAASGYRVLIHTSADNLTQRGVLAPRETYRGVEIRRYQTRFGLFWPDLNWSETSLLCLHNFNLLPHLWLYLVALVRSWWFPRTPIFLTPHGGFTPDWTIFPTWLRWLKASLHRLLGVFLLNHATAGIRAISQWEKDALLSQGVKSQHLHLISNGLAALALAPRRPRAVSSSLRQLVQQHPRYLLTLGRIAPIKNYATILRGLAASRTQLPIFIAGPIQDQSYFASIQSLAHELGITTSVHFLGAVSGEDKYFLYANCLAFLHFAQWESFCNVVYEAQSQGAICVVADNTALRSLVKSKQNGLLVGTADSIALTHILRKLHQPSPTFAAILSQIKYNLSQQAFFTWQQTAAQMAGVYQQIIRHYATH